MTEEQTKIPTWFWVVTVILLIWNLMGVANFFMHLTITEEALQAMTENERAMIENSPTWLLFAFGIAVFTGVGGCIALLMKKKAAYLLFVVSLITSVLQMGYSASIAMGMEDGTPMLIIAFLVIVFCVFLVWLAKHATKKDWIK